jgi:cell division protein FtsQ
MDRGGRLSRPVSPRRKLAEPRDYAPPSRATLFLRRALVRLSTRPFRHVGVFLFALLIAGTGGFGAARGGHLDVLLAALHEAGDDAARAFGFGIVQVDVRGARILTREDLLQRAGVTPHSSLLLLDAEGMRRDLKRDPRVAEVTIRKFYPDRLEIAIEERRPFARWQRAGKVHLIATDGTVLESDVESKRAELPLVVGIGAEKHVAGFVELLNRFPVIREQVRAGIFIAERRWNLRLKNGIDVKLPDEDAALALERLIALDKSKQLLSRDLTTIDLRVPDRVHVGLSPEAADALLKQKTTKRKGADS